MKKWCVIFGSLVVLVLIVGCESKAKARLQAQSAYIAGQQQAMAQQNIRTNLVVFIGPVRHAKVQWQQDLTLGKGLVAAEYVGRRDPHDIIVNRQGQRFPVDVKALLKGEDDPTLEAGDVVEIQR